jgi:hypothetical protein
VQCALLQTVATLPGGGDCPLGFWQSQAGLFAAAQQNKGTKYTHSILFLNFTFLDLFHRFITQKFFLTKLLSIHNVSEAGSASVFR